MRVVQETVVTVAVIAATVALGFHGTISGEAVAALLGGALPVSAAARRIGTPDK